jgi:hypothetical protein
MKLITFVINFCFNLDLMFIFFVKYSSVIKLDLFWKQAIVFVPGKQFQPNLVFASKARSLP